MSGDSDAANIGQPGVSCAELEEAGSVASRLNISQKVRTLYRSRIQMV